MKNLAIIVAIISFILPLTTEANSNEWCIKARESTLGNRIQGGDSPGCSLFQQDCAFSHQCGIVYYKGEEGWCCVSDENKSHKK